MIEEGSDVAILSFGAHLFECQVAADMVADDGITVTVADARFAKPLDTDLLMQLVSHHRALITVEQGAMGGFGSIVLHELARRGAFDKGLILRTLCLPDRFIDQADPADMYADAGLSATDIAFAIRAALAGRAEVVPLRQIR